MNPLKIACVSFCLLIILSCKKENLSVGTQSKIEVNRNTARTAAVATEDFEQGTKTTYANGTVTLSTGVWDFHNALLGNSSLDRKNGSQSARIRKSGKITMKFNHAGGASTVTVKHAKYGTDANGTWQLWYSTNKGATYIQAGSTITTSLTTLQTATFIMNVSVPVRFQIRKIDSGSNKINFDDFTITDYTAQKKFLFDATKAETAGNADWVIDEDNNTPQRFPTSAQSNIISSTSETYWTGALSSWGIALVKAGEEIETLASGTAITYGNTSNAQDLSNYDVFVVDEPNIVFTSSEKTAILNFVSSGGGLFMVSDHTQSDRNFDGWDSPDIWNDLMTNNTIKTNPFGFSIDLTNISEVSSNVLTNSINNTILNGSQGSVTRLEFNNGATITTQPSANASVQGLIWQNGYTQNTTHIMSASSAYGLGRVFVVADSSPLDDGTGASGNNLYVSWSLYSHASLFMNASLWLAKLQ